AELGKIGTHHAILVNLVYREQDIPYHLDGFGFVVPASEKRAISGCTFASVKFPSRAPRNRVILRAFLGREASRTLLAKHDCEIGQAARLEVEDILKFSAQTQAVFVHRAPDSLPQYRVGHLDVVAEIERLAGDIPGFALAGNAYRGTGIPDCIRS